MRTVAVAHKDGGLGSLVALACLVASYFALLLHSEKKEQEEEAEAAREESSEGFCEDPDSSPTPLNGAEIDVDGASRANWSVDIEYTEAEKIAMFDDYMASRWVVGIAAAADPYIRCCASFTRWDSYIDDIDEDARVLFCFLLCWCLLAFVCPLFFFEFECLPK